MATVLTPDGLTVVPKCPECGGVRWHRQICLDCFTIAQEKKSTKVRLLAIELRLEKLESTRFWR